LPARAPAHENDEQQKEREHPVNVTFDPFMGGIERGYTLAASHSVLSRPGMFYAFHSLHFRVILIKICNLLLSNSACVSINSGTLSMSDKFTGSLS
jgi:hypothetical protein